MAVGEYFHGFMDHDVDGRVVGHEFVLCSVGDWPELRSALGLEGDESWSTRRLGTLLLAEGPPCSDALPGLLPIAPLHRLDSVGPVHPRGGRFC